MTTPHQREGINAAFGEMPPDAAATFLDIPTTAQSDEIISNGLFTYTEQLINDLRRRCNFVRCLKDRNGVKDL